MKYVEEVDLKETRALAKKFVNAEAEWFLCKNVRYNFLLEDDCTYWELYQPVQKGYETAIERIPYFYEEDLLKLLNQHPTDRETLVKEVLA